MRIRLVKPAEWAGKKHRSGTIHDDVPDRIVKKLIARGYAEEHTDAGGDGRGSDDLRQPE